MFNKLKQLKDLRDQAKKMQSALAGENATGEKNGVKVKMSGNLEIINVEINNDLSKEALAEAFKSATNDAIKQTQRIMAKKMQEIGGFPGMN